MRRVESVVQFQEVQQCHLDLPQPRRKFDNRRHQGISLQDTKLGPVLPHQPKNKPKLVLY
ncbi:conserved hypothetical protein [Ricinus communis]|uniref:Uncharacterized protein n=1 Tax=Ricinus communis TaxID=3988 RepID=B9S1W9_RICCO|nr:conserved hypothetical protein [Ricinus communis]